ncbi:MAG: hypothetical protein F6K31_40175 [Symploca sp. SIO2G7]|nr:hypothetical protein [Symploca sp. SIO2G7]
MPTAPAKLIAHFVNPHIWSLSAQKTLYMERPKEKRKMVIPLPGAPLEHRFTNQN